MTNFVFSGGKYRVSDIPNGYLRLKSQWAKQEKLPSPTTRRVRQNAKIRQMCRQFELLGVLRPIGSAIYGNFEHYQKPIQRGELSLPLDR